MGDQVEHGPSLETLTRPRQLCLMIFAHPSRYAPLSTTGPNEFDIEIPNYVVNESKPMYGALFVSPLQTSENPRLTVKNMEVQKDVFCRFQKLTRTPDLLLQLAVGHGPSGPWPKYPTTAHRH